jgi:hypothetical protein
MNVNHVDCHSILTVYGGLYIPEVSPILVYETHVLTINWLFERFGDNIQGRINV